jgi:hypothetical protein
MKSVAVSCALLAAASLMQDGCRAAGSPRPERAPGVRAAADLSVQETIYDGRLGPGWNDGGWAVHLSGPGAPAVFDLSSAGAWMVVKPGLVGDFGGLLLRYAAPREIGDVLELRVDSSREVLFPRVVIGPAHRHDLDGDRTEAFVPMSELNPGGHAFDRVILRAVRGVPHAELRIETLALTAPPPPSDSSAAADPAAGTVRPSPAPALVTASTSSASSQPSPSTAGRVALAVDCAAASHRIDPMIYGIGFDPRRYPADDFVWRMGPGARRWGGNPSSRYNWELGRAWNTGNDWFFENHDLTGSQTFTYDTFLRDDQEHHVLTALSVPMLGWVAKDTTSYSFPVSQVGPQQQTDPQNPDAGNGVAKSGATLTGDRARTSVAQGPESIGRWVSAIREADARRGRSVHMYILDNEPELWSSTHRDVRPEPLSADELLQKTIAYGTAIRKADPDAVIAGPASWGWTAYFYSGVDTADFHLKPDYLRHAAVPLLAWYLRSLRAYEEKTGIRVLDVLDVHFYPMAKNVTSVTAVDPATAALRLRATRSLWDPSYVDESWIADRVRLIPRLSEWVDANYPGRGISIGEWNFGAPNHASGGLATAEALGRFGQQGLRSAFYWDYPPENSAAFHAFRAFRNYDGAGHRFLDWSVATHASDPISLFASRDESGRTLVMVALNKDPEKSAAVEVDLGTCGEAVQRRTFTDAGTGRGLVPGAARTGEGRHLVETLAPYSTSVLEIELAPGGSH